MTMSLSWLVWSPDIFAKMRVSEPVFAAVRALAWVNQAVTIVCKTMKFNDLTVLLGAAKNVPITDRYVSGLSRHARFRRRFS